MAQRHQRDADHHDLLCAQPAIGQQPAEQRGEIDESGVEPEGLAGEGLCAELAENALYRSAIGGHSGNLVDTVRNPQILHHVEDKQSAHTVEAEPHPHLSEGTKIKTLRMAQEKL